MGGLLALAGGDAGADAPATSGGWSGQDACFLARLPGEVQAALGLTFLGLPQPVGRLACASRELRSRLCDAQGRLCVSSVAASTLSAAAGSLHCVSFKHLTALRVDLLADSAKLLRRDVEGLVARLGESLGGAAALEALALRLASFDASMERLWLGRRAWASLVQGLGALARLGRLRVLELSFVAVKLSRATEAVALRGAEGPLTLLRALSELRCLEEISLTHADIFGATVAALAETLRGLPRLRKVDLSRNRISRKAWAQLRAALGPEVQVCGGDLQTTCCEDSPSGRPVF